MSKWGGDFNLGGKNKCLSLGDHRRGTRSMMQEGNSVTLDLKEMGLVVKAVSVLDRWFLSLKYLLWFSHAHETVSLCYHSHKRVTCICFHDHSCHVKDLVLLWKADVSSHTFWIRCCARQYVSILKPSDLTDWTLPGVPSDRDILWRSLVLWWAVSWKLEHLIP